MKKRIYLPILWLFITAKVFAQGCDIPLAVHFDKELLNIPTNASNVLLNTLERILIEESIAGNKKTSQFILTAHCDVLDKSYLPGPPAQTAYNIGLTLYVADIYKQKVFNSTYITLKGVGNNEDNCYINAFKQIKANNPEIKKMIENSKNKIVDYYDSQYHSVIKEAERLASMQKYEDALALVFAIPVCSKGYDKAQQYGYTLYIKHLDRMNLFLLNRAKALWSANQSEQIALDVCEMLANIDPYATCYDDAVKLMTEIKEQVRSDIDFEMRQKYQDSIQLEKDRIKAAMAVGVAYGNHQQPTKTNLMWLK